MKPWQRDPLRRALEKRREALSEELDRDAARLRAERAAEVADVIPDPGEMADESRDVEELREIDAALARLDDGSYGICVDCGGAIGNERLQAEPAAARCVECQSRHEKTYRR
jgi:DnaK suppressor protein